MLIFYAQYKCAEKFEDHIFHVKKNLKTVSEAFFKTFFLNGKLHRKHKPADVKNKSYQNQYEAWYLHGNLHREDGPALTFGGSQKWFKHGKLHREDGPAVYNKSDGWTEWMYNGIHINVYTQEEFENWKKFKAFL